MRVNSLFNVPGSRKPRKRIGRGNGSGTGRTGGRGEKGQKSRSGVAIKTEGGQMPIIKRLPKRGFNSSKSISYTPISMADIEFLIIEKRIDSSVLINKASLVDIGYIKSEKTPVKLLAGVDKMNFKITVQLDAYSKTARELIEKAGGQVL
ncbi:MAG: 50S ribosomal protein L15 [Rickettsiaceae bacterium]|jgi:large subunit ribosomal protein L15|nr:50S ribosomal protein L15 [Rickettsiaceae bacterium]MCP5377800.1 50S ribosomal protein L15 [Rickettsiaceae bacterium]